MRRVLKTNGVLVINSFGDLNSKQDFLTTSLHKTLKSVFKNVRVHPGESETLFFVAGNSPELTILRPQNVDDVYGSLREAAAKSYQSNIQVPLERGQVLTDDFNPAEFYDAKNRETLRRDLAMSMKRLQ